jgi:hypothetical protein
VRRLEQVNTSIQQLRALQDAGRPIEIALVPALDEERRLRNWIALHEHRR